MEQNGHIRMRIGLDFGTVNTKIAYLSGNGELEFFRHPGAEGERSIPTAVAYCQNPAVIQVGQSAITAAKSVRATRLVQQFKPSLAAEGSAEAPTRDFLERILLTAVDSLAQELNKSNETIDGVVVAAPQAWVDAPDSGAVARLTRILRDELHLPLLFVESEPVCAAAAFVYQFTHGRRSLAQTHVLVCDAGSGFSATLCRVDGQTISVLDSESSAGPGGVAYDAGCLSLLYEETHKKKPPQNPTDYLELFKQFEQTKLDQPLSVGGVIARLDAANPLFADTPLYTVAGRYTVQLRHVARAFQPIGQHMADVLRRLLGRLAEQHCAIDHVLVVGGFGQFPLVEQVIGQALPHGPAPDLTLNRENRPFAVATGAMLLANEIVVSRPTFRHTLGVFTNQKIGGRWQRGELAIVRAGRTRTGMLTPEFALSADGQPELLEIRAGEAQPLPVYIQPPDAPAQAWTPELSEPVAYPPAGQYKVGMHVDLANQVTLIFESTDPTHRFVYPLGSLPAL